MLGLLVVTEDEVLGNPRVRRRIALGGGLLALRVFEQTRSFSETERLVGGCNLGLAYEGRYSCYFSPFPVVSWSSCQNPTDGCLLAGFAGQDGCPSICSSGR